MSYICEYVRKPFEESEKVKIACWQPALPRVRMKLYAHTLNFLYDCLSGWR